MFLKYKTRNSYIQLKRIMSKILQYYPNGVLCLFGIRKPMSMVLFHMFLQLTRLFARIVTFCASKGLLASVRKLVILKAALISAREVALIARKGFFSGMLPHVYLQTTSMGACIVTLITAEPLLP